MSVIPKRFKSEQERIDYLKERATLERRRECFEKPENVFLENALAEKETEDLFRIIRMLFEDRREDMLEITTEIAKEEVEKMEIRKCG